MDLIKKHWKLICILLGIFLLRLPSFFEPYWYGDEGIYLVLGQAMQRGAVLYRDIWDNKPPLLYLIYAVSPTLLWAKITATACLLGTCTGVYALSKKLWPVVAVGILMSLPYPILEGTIANAELYFTLPVVIGAYIFWTLINKRISHKKYLLSFLSIGFLMTIAFLLKVPAAFDFEGMFLAVYIFFLAEPEKFTKNSFIKQTLFFIRKICLPALLPFLIILSVLVVYFYANHALSDFLTASFSQNATYVAVGTGPLSKLSNPLFVKAFELLVALLILTVLYFKKRVTKEFIFLSFWFGFSLYGSLLSNRPYPHYLLQVVPPVILLLAYLLTDIKKNFLFIMVFVFVLWTSIVMFGQNKAVIGLLDNLKNSYYSNFFDYISERKTWGDYVSFFDPGTQNNYNIADYLDQNSKTTDPIFVWGDASFVYVLSNRPPATKFIQAHHLTTIAPINYDLVIERLTKYQPKFIIVARPPHFEFPKLEEFLKKNYSFAESFNNLYVYQNISRINPPTFNQNYQ